MNFNTTLGRKNKTDCMRIIEFKYLFFNIIKRELEKIGCSGKLYKKISQLTRYYQQMNIVNDSFINYVKKKKVSLDLHRNDIKVLALRGSNADYGFYPDYIKGAFNLGLTSSDLYITYQMYINYLKDLPNLETIVVYYSISACGLNLSKTVERYIQVVYDYYFNIQPQENTDFDKKRVRYVKSMCEHSSKIEMDTEYWGYETKTDFLNISAAQRVKTHMRENRREPTQLLWLEKLSQAIDGDRKHLIIVITPFRSDYKQALGDEMVFEKLFNIKFPNSTKILDFYDSPIFNDSDMGDTDHLNEQGAKRLTLEIKKHLYNLFSHGR